MTSKEFVKERYPQARAEKYYVGQGVVRALQRKYFLIWDKPGGNRIGEGDTESKAWVEAKNRIIESESLKH